MKMKKKTVTAIVCIAAPLTAIAAVLLPAAVRRARWRKYLHGGC